MVVAMEMKMTAVWLKIDAGRVVQALQEAGKKLDSVDGEVALDFSSVYRIDPSAIGAMQEFASIADKKRVKVVLRGVNVGVYKVLKLVRLASRFSFVS
jgi:anti-anti-sigma regulatory factor